MAVYTDKHVAIFPPKYATTLLDAVLREQCGALPFGAREQPEPHHAPFSLLQQRYPDIVSSRTAFAPARPPWGWYRSWYLHQARSHREHSTAQFRIWLYAWTHSVQHHATSSPMLWHSEGHGPGLGLYSTVFASITTGVSVFIPVERLADGLFALTGQQLDLDRVNEAQQPFPPIADLYDIEMRAWVTEADGALIDRFGWRFREPCPTTVWTFPT